VVGDLVTVHGLVGEHADLNDQTGVIGHDAGAAVGAATAHAAAAVLPDHWRVDLSTPVSIKVKPENFRKVHVAGAAVDPAEAVEGDDVHVNYVDTLALVVQTFALQINNVVVKSVLDHVAGEKEILDVDVPAMENERQNKALRKALQAVLLPFRAFLKLEEKVVAKKPPVFPAKVHMTGSLELFHF
jgi:hypothetical protein